MSLGDLTAPAALRSARRHGPAYATAAALLYVACLLACGLADLDWEDLTGYAPTVVAALATPLTYAIATAASVSASSPAS